MTVAHVPSTLFAPLYVAEARGYFQDERLDVQLQAVKSGQDAIPLAASGKLDAIVAGFSSGLFGAVASGLDIKVVGSMGASGGDPADSSTTLEVAKGLVDDGRVPDASALRGKRVAVAGGAGGAGGYTLDTMLRPAGLSLADVEVVNLSFPDMQAALQNGGVDAATAITPFTYQMHEDGASVQVAVPPRGTVASGVIYGGAFAETDQAARFFAALTRASQDLQDGGAKSPEVLDILAEATGQELEVLQQVPAYLFRPDLAPDAEQLGAMQEVYRSAGLLDVDRVLAADDLVDERFAGAVTE